MQRSIRRIKNLSFGVKFIRSLTIIIFLLLLGLYIYPLIWVALSGFKTTRELFLGSFSLPSSYKFDNFVGVWNFGISRYFINSVYITILSCLLTTIISSLASFPLSRYKFKLRRPIFMFLLGGLSLVPQVSLISNYKILLSLNLYNTPWALILTYVAFRIPFTMFLMWSYFMTLPIEVEEAACIEGCSSFASFRLIIVPMSRPIVATSIMLTARYVWNDFLFALVFTESAALRTIPYGLYSLRGESGTNWGYLMAGMTLAAIPMILLFLFTQKQFVRGLTIGGVKG